MDMEFGKKVLYYPYIRVPENEWFMRVLLYWDQVGSVVPEEYQRDSDYLGSFMKELIDANLVKPISPRDYLDTIPDFEETFLNLVDKLIPSNLHLDKSTETFKIHFEKFTLSLARELEKRELAVRESGSWYRLEKRTAELYMAYISLILGSLEDIQMTPITDTPSQLLVFSKRLKDWVQNNYENQETILHAFMNDELLLIKDILPGPSPQTPVKKLIKFKEKNYDLLVSFRRKIESLLLSIESFSDTTTKRQRLQLLQDELSDQIQEIREELRRAQLILISHALLGILNLGISLQSGILGILSGVANLTSGIYNILHQKKQILKNPLAYVVKVERGLF